MTGLAPSDFFDLSDRDVARFFDGCDFVWEALHHLRDRISDRAGTQTVVLGQVMEGAVLGDGPIRIEEGAVVEPGTFIQGPCYIGRGAGFRHGAYIRGEVVLLEGAVLGHTSEAKNSLLLPNAKAPHFAYLGDSLIGARVNLGARTKLSNLAITSKRDPRTRKRPTISVWNDGTRHDTGLTKFGAILGDDVGTGCNCVLNPGTLIGPRSIVHASASVPRGVYPPDTVLKLRQDIDSIPI